MPLNLTGSPLNYNVTTDYKNTNNIGTYGDKGIVGNTKELKSLFNNHKFTPFPKGIPDAKTGFATEGSSNLHNDDVYDVSITKLIEFSSAYPAMSLKAADFAYLKDVGVFPNNRMIIARRFPAPVGNDLTAFKDNAPTPLSTLISWVGNDDDFLDISFGEEWVPAKASFEEILNGIGKDITLSSDNRAGMGQLGTKLAGGLGAIPLPGLMEGLQQKLFVALGIADPNSNDLIIPLGDPNLIREAMQRKTIAKGEAGSGLKTDFRIKMNVKYEQKYINGVDPTLVYFDMIANILSFATSDARFMFNESFATGTTGILRDLISGNISGIQSAIEKFISTLTTVINSEISKLTDLIRSSFNKTKAEESDKSTPTINIIAKNTIGAIIGKYKEAIKGVIASLTGVASTPWHVTIGNPQRPIFSSGDLYMDNVKLKMGPVLSYNDLPSSLEVEFELRPARSLGAQEIFNRFNTGRARTYQRRPDFSSANSDQVIVGKDDTIKQQDTNNGKANVSNADNRAKGTGNPQPSTNSNSYAPLSYYPKQTVPNTDNTASGTINPLGGR